jgi:Flp pilus assembly protein TadB
MTGDTTMACADHPFGAYRCNACAFNADAADRERAADRRHREMLAEHERAAARRSISSAASPSDGGGDLLGGLIMTAVAVGAAAIVYAVYLVGTNPLPAVAACIAVIALLRHWTGAPAVIRRRAPMLVVAVLVIVGLSQAGLVVTLVAGAIAWVRRAAIADALGLAPGRRG